MSETSTDPYALVVDDEPLIQLDAVEILRGFGFRTFEAAILQKGFTILEEHGSAVTILFTDVRMPGPIDGFEFARKVAEIWPAIAIIVASEDISPGDGDLPPGAHFIAKPFSADLIRDHLTELLPDGKKPEPLKQGYPIPNR